MKIKKAIKTLYKCEIGEIDNIPDKDIDKAVNAGRKALMCWLWMCKSVEAGLSDEDIMKVVRSGFMEALTTDE